MSVSSLELGGQKEMDWHTFCVSCSYTASATQQCELKDLGHNPCGETRRRVEHSVSGCLLLSVCLLSKFMQSSWN